MSFQLHSVEWKKQLKLVITLQESLFKQIEVLKKRGKFEGRREKFIKFHSVKYC